MQSSFYEVRGTPIGTGIPVQFNKKKKPNAIKKAQAMVRSRDFFFITITRDGQHILDFNGRA